MLFLGEIAAAIALLAFWWFYQSKKKEQYFQNIPSPPTVPILGNALDFKSTAEFLTTLCRYKKEFGDLVRIQIGPSHSILLASDYKFIEFVMNSTKLITKSREYNYLGPWLGTGLLTSTGRKWKSHRRVLTPAFHFQILKNFVEVFDSCSNKLVEKFKQVTNKDNVDIYTLVTLCSLDIICESTMGVTVNAQDNENSEYVRSVKEMCKIIIDRSTTPLEMYDLSFPLTPNFYRQRRDLKILHGHTNAVIKSRMEERRNNPIEVDNNLEVKKKKAFLDLILDVTVDGKPLTPEEIREEVDTFMFEGHDTTASGVSFTLYCIATHPEVQKRAFDEQQIIFGHNKNPTVTYTDLQNMKYLEQVIKEALRIYPSVPVYGRIFHEDTKYNGTRFPEGTSMMIFAYGIQRDPRYFDNPEEFNPSRFDNIDGSQPYAYIPFSAGPRNCIGQKFAMLSMKSTISKILRNFQLRPATPKHDLKLIAETILKSSNGIKIGLKERIF